MQTGTNFNHGEQTAGIIAKSPTALVQQSHSQVINQQQAARDEVPIKDRIPKVKLNLNQTNDGSMKLQLPGKRPVDSINDYHWKYQTVRHRFLTQGTLDLLNESEAKKAGVRAAAVPGGQGSPYQKRIKPDVRQKSPYKNNVLLYQVVLEKDAETLMNQYLEIQPSLNYTGRSVQNRSNRFVSK